jgi:hypothetical protein
MDQQKIIMYFGHGNKMNKNKVLHLFFSIFILLLIGAIIGVYFSFLNSSSIPEKKYSGTPIGGIDLIINYSINDISNVSNITIVKENLKSIGYYDKNQIENENVSWWSFPLQKQLPNNKGIIFIQEINVNYPEIIIIYSGFNPFYDDDNKQLIEHKEILLHESLYISNKIGIHFSLDNSTWHYNPSDFPPKSSNDQKPFYCFGIILSPIIIIYVTDNLRKGIL